MCAYFSLLGSFLLLCGLKYQSVKSLNIEKSVTTLQQIYKQSSHSNTVKVENLKEMPLNAISMRDISNAFKAITDDSSQISQLIPKMFKVNVSNPTYVFSLPQEKGHNFLTMHRDNFSDPIFPNLTSSYIHLMRSKRKLSEYVNVYKKNHIDANDPLEDRFSSNLIEDNESILALNIQTERNFIDFLNNVNKKENKETFDEWKLLGLDGWQGHLSKDSKELYLNGKGNKDQILEWDLPGKMREKILTDNLIEAMKNNKFMHIVENLTQQLEYPITNPHDLHSDLDVYIGRVNDPFGHSTKWNGKNSSTDNTRQDRKKRGVIELFSMIKCSTGCDPIIFKGYGCYCGFLGDGYPVDGIDRCCRMHDKCYEYSNCIPYLEYFVPYIWKCYRGKPLCAIDHGEWGGPQSCAARLCQCDLSLSRCLRRFLCPHRRGICRTSKTRMLQNILLNF